VSCRDMGKVELFFTLAVAVLSDGLRPRGKGTHTSWQLAVDTPRSSFLLPSISLRKRLLWCRKVQWRVQGLSVGIRATS
jgi:hypothetical protein